MGYHLETYRDEVGWDRSGTDRGELAKVLHHTGISLQRREVKAAHLFSDPSDSTLAGSGAIVAVYTDQEGWTEVAADPRPWWDGLSQQTRTALRENPGMEPSAAQVLEICQAGGSVSAAWWPASQPGPRFSLPHDLQAFVQSMAV